MFIFEEVGTESMNTQNEDIMCRNQAEVLLRKAKKYYIDSINELNKKGDKLVIRGAIVIGYPGIGKSTLSKNINKCIDLDSSTFSGTNGWEVIYCNTAISLAKDNNIVFVSCHDRVQQFFNSIKCLVPVFVCYPSINICNEWIVKLASRFNNDPSPKNRRALARAVSKYEEDISNLEKTHFHKIIIESTDYDLVDGMKQASLLR